MNLEFSEIKLHNPGILKTRIPVNIFGELTQDLQKQVDAKPETYNSRLMGHIESEFNYVPTDAFKECIISMWKEYRVRFNYYINNNFWVEDNTWVNFQKKHEYNPIHHHFQDISWVTWVSIPYSLDNEGNAANVKNSNGNVASKFQFIYNKLDGGIYTQELDIDRSWEGVIIMFPSYLKHQVYPFQTTDAHRISIAGNITIQDK